MAWETLRSIEQLNRSEREREQREPPLACPYDGEPLDIRSDGTRNCPLGNYTWRGEPRII